MKKVLVVEDSKFFSSIIKHKIESTLGISVLVVETMKAAKMVLDVRKEDIFIACLDLTLPDATNTEIVETVNSYGIPSIIFSSTYNEELMQEVKDFNVVDYVIKDNPSSFDYLTSLINRYHNNENIRVLVVEDSLAQLKIAEHILKKYNLNVLTARNGKEAVEIIEQENQSIKTKISLVITDYDMPEMDGFDLILKLRKEWSRNELGIIGVSAAGDKKLPSKFLKFGADDFILKPVQSEEFISRVAQNLNNLEQIDKLNYAATRDYLTGMYNRRYFFKTVIPSLEKAKKKNQEVLVAMIDVDFFKKVNDTHGHHVGDEVLVEVAKVLSEQTREEDLVARFGGEEFCLFGVGLDKEVVENYLNHIRVKISELSFKSDVGEFNVTASIGASINVLDNIDSMINDADDCLYDAKETGRNKVVLKGTK